MHVYSPRPSLQLPWCRQGLLSHWSPSAKKEFGNQSLWANDFAVLILAHIFQINMSELEILPCFPVNNFPYLHFISSPPFTARCTWHPLLSGLLTAVSSFCWNVSQYFYLTVRSFGLVTTWGQLEGWRVCERLPCGLSILTRGMLRFLFPNTAGMKRECRGSCSALTWDLTFRGAFV